MIHGIELKGFKEIEGHGDSRTFNANIYLNGKKIGWCGNNGWGGPNEYRFSKDSDKRKFGEIAKNWTREMLETGEVFVTDIEVEDSFVEELIMDLSTVRTKSKNLKKGFPITVICKKGKNFPYKDCDGFDNFFQWDEEWIMGFRNLNQVEPYIKKEKVDFHKIIDKEDKWN